MKKKLLSVFSYIIIIFLMINIAINAFIPEKSVEYLGYRTFIILSGSMDPTIEVNDMIVITKTTEDSLEVGDIITFSVYIPELGTKSYVTHYIANIIETESGTIYKTQGEGKDDDDYDVWKDAQGEVIEISFDDIEGVYLFQIDSIGSVISFLQNPIYLGLIIINVIVVYSTVKYIIKSKKESEDEDAISEDDYIE